MRLAPLLAALLSGCALHQLRELPPPPPSQAGAAQKAGVDPVKRRFERADWFSDAGRPAEAVMELREAEKVLEPSDPRRVDEAERLALVYLSEGDAVHAQQAFIGAAQAARELGVSGEPAADALAGIGVCLSEQGRHARALEYLRKGLDLGPSAAMRARAQKASARSAARLGEDEELDRPGPELLVTRIVFHGNRADDLILRKRLPFSEGDTIRLRELRAAKAALERLELFRSVAIATSPLEGGSRVDVTVEDGWSVVPAPVYATGTGRARGGGIVEARNLFDRAETIDAAVLLGPAGRLQSASVAWEGWAARFAHTHRQYGERLYADGAFSSTRGLGAPLDEASPAHFGAVADRYGKTTDDVELSLEAPISGLWSASVGLDHGAVSYDSPAPTAPGGPRKDGNVFAAARYGPAQSPLGLGALVGFGLAGLDERLKPLRRPQWSTAGEVRLVGGGRASASGTTYGELLGRVETAYSWDGRQSAWLSVAGGHGSALPDNRLLATGPLTGLEGSYAREYRGATAAGVSLGYGRRVRATRLGAWQLGAFLEEGRAWFRGDSGDAQGAGVLLSYRFWRFPLPLGVAYTYGFSDQYGVVSAGIGGRF